MFTVQAEIEVERFIAENHSFEEYSELVQQFKALQEELLYTCLPVCNFQLVICKHIYLSTCSQFCNKNTSN